MSGNDNVDIAGQAGHNSVEESKAKSQVEGDPSLGNYEEGSLHDLIIAKRKHTRHWTDGFRDLVYWYPKEDYLPEERKLLFKLDVVILLYTCASYFTKSLDKASITNAYGSGMEEDIKFFGNDLSYAKSLYSAGYIISMCFGVMFVTRDWTRQMLPVLEVIWGVLTFCQAAVSKPSHLFALRFLIGLAEGPIFPCTVYILGSWYTKREIYRRVMVFSVSSALGGMFSGFLQEAAYSHLAGKHGIAGWKWGFIIDGIFTLPIGLIGFFVFPGTPSQVKNLWWLKQEELKLAFTRMQISGVGRPRAISVDILKRTFLSWRVHFFTAFWVLLNVVALPDGVGFQLWIKSQIPKRFTVANYNYYPNLQATVGIVVQWVFAGLVEQSSVYPFVTIVQVCFIVSYSSLAAWNIADGWRWVCFLIIGLDTVNQALVSGWINRACRRDSEERAFVLGFSDAVSQAMNIWTNIAFYPTSKAPEFHLGYIISAIAAAIMLVMPVAAYFLEKRDNRLEGEDEEDVIDDLVKQESRIAKAESQQDSLPEPERVHGPLATKE